MSEWDEVADILDKHADDCHDAALASAAVNAAIPLVRRIDSDTADLLTVQVIGGSRVQDRTGAAGLISGAASAARLLGPGTTNKTGTGTSVNVSTIATANAEATAVATASAKAIAKTALDLMLERSDIPPEATAELEAMKRAIDEGDKTSLVQHAAEASKLLTTFPLLASAAIDLGTQIAGLL